MQWDCVENPFPITFCFHDQSSVYLVVNTISPVTLHTKITHIWHELSDSRRTMVKTKHTLWARKYHLSLSNTFPEGTVSSYQCVMRSAAVMHLFEISSSSLVVEALPNRWWQSHQHVEYFVLGPGESLTVWSRALLSFHWRSDLLLAVDANWKAV